MGGEPVDARQTGDLPSSAEIEGHRRLANRALYSSSRNNVFWLATVPNPNMGLTHVFAGSTSRP